MRIVVIIFLITFLVSCSKTEQVSIIVPANQLDESSIIKINHITSELEKSPNAKQKDTLNENSTEVTVEIPRKYDNIIDFAAQAPHANWDLPYQEACEEASLIMASYGLSNKALTANIMDSEILSAVEWQKEAFGFYEDTNSEQVLQMAKEHFNLNVHKVLNPSINLLKKELSDGNLIIAFLAGRQLNNPNFSGEGPLYHALVIRGYDTRNFITNDPGTKNGESYKYKYKTIMNALHDWNDGDVENGQKVVIVVEKP